MKKFSKPWHRASRDTWYVTLDGRQINLGRDRKAAFAQYKKLLAQPKKQRTASESLAVIVDAFLEWTQKSRSPETYEWYRYGIERSRHRRHLFGPRPLREGEGQPLVRLRGLG